MSSQEHPEFPCCGGLAFHAGGPKCDEYRYPPSKPAMPLLQPSIYDLVISDLRDLEHKRFPNHFGLATIEYAYQEALDRVLMLRKALAERSKK